MGLCTLYKRVHRYCSWCWYPGSTQSSHLQTIKSNTKTHQKLTYGKVDDPSSSESASH